MKDMLITSVDYILALPWGEQLWFILIALCAIFEVTYVILRKKISVMPTFVWLFIPLYFILWGLIVVTKQTFDEMTTIGLWITFLSLIAGVIFRSMGILIIVYLEKMRKKNKKNAKH